MTPAERIKRTLEFKIPDRVGIYDNTTGDFPEFDLVLFDLYRIDRKGYKKAKDKKLFVTLSLSDPFQRATEESGLENLLLLLAEKPEKATADFAKSIKSIIKRCLALFDKGFKFDGVWVWSDLAYKNGTYFSAETYKKILYPHHKRLFAFFEKQGLPVIFHCDGNCNAFIPLLLEAGVRALNPLEINCGFSDAESLKKEYGRKLVLFGNMPTAVLEKGREDIEAVFKKRLRILKSGGGFIYHCDNPIPETVSLENYQFALDIVKEYGVY